MTPRSITCGGTGGRRGSLLLLGRQERPAPRLRAPGMPNVCLFATAPWTLWLSICECAATTCLRRLDLVRVAVLFFSRCWLACHCVVKQVVRSSGDVSNQHLGAPCVYQATRIKQPTGWMDRSSWHDSVPVMC